MKRAGSTLIEFTMTLPILVMLMVLMVGGVKRGMEVYQIAKKRANVSQALSRLELVIRSDARTAFKASIGNGTNPNVMVLETSDQSHIEYVRDIDEIRRTVTFSDGSSHFDSFHLFENSSVEWSVKQNADPESESQIPTISINIWRIQPLETSVKRLEASMETPIRRFAITKSESMPND